MKSIFILFAMVVLSISLAAQTSPVPNGTARTHSHDQLGQAAKPEHDMPGMMEKCMESMQKQLPAAEKTLAEMKAALGQMNSSDAAAKRFAELNVQMWEAEVSHMKEMAAMHSEMKEKMKTSHEMRENEKH